MDQGIKSCILYRAFGTDPWPIKTRCDLKAPFQQQCAKKETAAYVGTNIHPFFVLEHGRVTLHPRQKFGQAFKTRAAEKM